MPDIQAGEVEVTSNEAKEPQQRNFPASDEITGIMKVDELGHPHDESAFNHLGRS